ncbi:hypothetical protein [Agromyces sp. S2-1-8]|uniref:hypothetical protein n=1 Tax=Agromyces sp. S2-1-8 TaxID=2897180 RepID=UPI001E28609A|nr:hypothetical protein [Agromyces sp. S2-1-8]MCD5347195.1 hypothetical protein [Agromyces sp. S2-1-8]
MSRLDDGSGHDRLWPLTLLRFSLALTSVLLFGQAVSAGLFMGGVPVAFGLHREMATVSGVALMVAILATILARALSRAPRWPIAATIGLLALMSLQAFAGFRSLVALHVPLGVVVILLSVALTVWVWRRMPRQQPNREDDREGPEKAAARASVRMARSNNG